MVGLTIFKKIRKVKATSNQNGESVSRFGVKKAGEGIKSKIIPNHFTIQQDFHQVIKKCFLPILTEVVMTNKRIISKTKSNYQQSSSLVMKPMRKRIIA